MAGPVLEAPSQVEIELKFVVPQPQLEALKRAMRRGEVRVQHLQAIYYDTADERLAAQGASIRLRKEGRQWVQTAKALTPDALRRLENNFNVTAPRGRSAPELDIARHDGTPVGAAIRAALGHAVGASHDASLRERFRIDVSRTTRTERVGGACVELALDTGTILAGERSIPICEFELELKSGPVAELLGLATLWAVDAGLWLSTVSKAERGARLVRGEVEGPPVFAVTPVIDADAGPAGFLVATIESCLKQILGNASEVGAGAVDEQLVHQLRVGLRRLRTALRELSGFAPGIEPAWEAMFGRTFQELGAHRDRVTVIPAILEALSSAGVHYPQAPSGSEEIRSPEAVVREPDFQRTLLAVIAFCHAPPASMQRKRGGRKELRRRVARLLDDLHNRLARDAKRFEKLSTTRQHGVRKRLKRLRYLGEFAAPLFDAKRAKRYLASWQEAQDALGEYNDHRIGKEAIRSDSHSGAHAKPALRWIAARLQTCVKQCARALRNAARRPVFWET